MPTKKLISLPEHFVPWFHDHENLPRDEWYAGSDPPGTKTGSGGGTANLLAEAWKAGGKDKSFNDWLAAERKIIIHAGGQSRRLPSYSVRGKSSIPVPVFRWSKGQYIDQKLLDFQAGFYERVFEKAPGDYVCLIGSGDVMFYSPDRFSNLPEADILCLGIWVDDDTASRHGVFFSKKEHPEVLSFGLQKPSTAELEDLSSRYYYLMDSGIWLLNPKACRILMKKCGWDEGRSEFTGGIPDFYDLYGSMGMAFGEEAQIKDADVNALEVKIHPIDDGEFYHFGSNRDLIRSNEALQNRIIDQRKIWHQENRRHPTIFQQNSIVDITFSGGHENIWIENSHIGSRWKLNSEHIITGIPGNQWTLELPQGTCIDMVKTNDGGYCFRVYGFEDSFRGSIRKGVSWMNGSLEEWLKKHDILPADMNLEEDDDIFSMPLFPVVKDVDEAGTMISWMCGNGRDEDRQKMREKYLRSGRLSAANIPEKADIPSIREQQLSYKRDVLQKLAGNRDKSIFYHLDLKKAACDFVDMGIELPPPPRKDETVVRMLSDRMFRAVAGKDGEGKKYEKEAFGILRESILDSISDVELRPQRNILDDQILWGRSPVRLDLAGGWSDTPPYCIVNGGRVVNLSVELNGQPPLQVFARPLNEHKIVLRSIDLGLKEEIFDFEGLDSGGQAAGAFSIPKAALVLSGFGNEFSEKKYPSLEKQLKDFGCGIELSLLAAVPKGSGLGTSSNLAATVLGVLNEFGGLGRNRHDICHYTLILEQILSTGGGWQDQYGGIFHGIKLLESGKGIIQKPAIQWLPETLFTSEDTKPLFMLYYTGVTRMAKDILSEIVKGIFLNSSSHLKIIDEISYHALETSDAIQRNDYDALASKVGRSWILNQRLDRGTNPALVQDIISRVEDKLAGFKLLGAGGGGYMLMMAKDAEAARQVRQALTQDPPNAKARFVDINVSRDGFRVSRS